MSDNYRQPIPTPDGFRVASRPETLARRWREAFLERWKVAVKRYQKIVPPYHRRKVRYSALFALTAAVVGTQAFFHNPAPLTVYFYDIGQGDGIHIRTAAGFDAVIDSGPHDTVAEKLGRTLPFWDRTIELMVLTHPHADHMVGQIAVMKRFKVERVLATGVLHTTDEYLTWLKEIKEQGITMEVAQAGQLYVLGQSALRRQPAQKPQNDLEAVLEILWPKENLSGKRIVEKSEADGGLNATSIVARLTYGKTSFLLTGDAEKGVEEQLLRRHSCKGNELRINSNITNYEFAIRNIRTHSPFGSQYDGEISCSLRVDVLKVGHHGSKTSTSKEFLQAVAPKYAVIQSGRNNRFGHPHFPTLWRLKQAGAQILRNDRDGDIIFETDGTTLDYQVKGVR